MKEIVFRNKTYKISTNMLNYICRDFILSKEETLEEIYQNYPLLFDITNLYCKSGSGEKLWSYFKLCKKDNIFKNKANNGIEGFVFLKELYSPKFYKTFKSLKLNSHLKNAFYFLINNGVSLENVNEELIRKTYNEKCSGEGSPIGKFKQRNQKSYENFVERKREEKKIEMQDKSKNPYSKKFWKKKGFTLKEAKLKVKERNKFCSEFYLKKGKTKKESKLLAKENNPSNLNNYKNINDFLEKSPIRKEYWIKLGYSFDEAKFLTRSYRGTTKEYWIKRGYNENESLIKAKENNCWCVEYWIKRKYNKETFYTFKENMYKKSNKILGIGISNVSKFFFKSLIKSLKLNQKYIDDFIFTFVTKGYEKCMLGFFPDFIDENKKLIIEFNGNPWHANPLYYKENDFPHPYNLNITAKEIWEKEKIKLKKYKDAGYTTFIVWETDDKKTVINEIITKFY